MTVLTVVRAHWRLALSACLVAAAFAAGWAAHPPATVEETVAADESKGLDLRTHVVKEPTTRVVERVTIREKLVPATGQVQERTETHETSRSETGKTTTDTQEKVQDDLHLAKTVKVSEPAPLHAYVEVGPSLDLSTGAFAGQARAGVTYRVLGPVYVGGEVLVPIWPAPKPPVVSVVLGVGL